MMGLDPVVFLLGFRSGASLQARLTQPPSRAGQTEPSKVFWWAHLRLLSLVGVQQFGYRAIMCDVPFRTVWCISVGHLFSVRNIGA
jgi:hypothetical protein